MRYFVISGEASGDFLGGLLAKQLKTLDENATIQAWGGQHLKRHGAQILLDISTLSFMGFSELIGNAIKITGLLNTCKRQISSFSPDVIILIDFGGFNMRLAKWAHKKGYKIVYYVPPKIWASRSWRVRALRRYVDLLVVLFPFEYNYFRLKELPVSFFGNPYASFLQRVETEDGFREKHNLDERPIASILPGSRMQEIDKMLPIAIEAIQSSDEFNWCVSCLGQFNKEYYELHLSKSKSVNLNLIFDDHIQLLKNSHCAIVTSGTATLEAALLNVPQLVGYKTSWLNYLIAKRLINVPFISLPNLILEGECVLELIQEDFNPKRIETELKKLLSPASITDLHDKYLKIQGLLHGDAPSKRTAEAIISLAE